MGECRAFDRRLTGEASPQARLSPGRDLGSLEIATSGRTRHARSGGSKGRPAARVCRAEGVRFSPGRLQSPRLARIGGRVIGTFTSALVRVFLDGSLFLLSGFLLAGLLAEFVRAERITRFLGGSGLRPVFLATVLGAPLPLCSCSVVPAARELRRKG